MANKASSDQPVRFTCPINPLHVRFYRREHYSEAYAIDAHGNLAPEATRNTFEGDGSDPVRCADCEAEPNGLWPGPDAIDATPDKPRREA